MKRFLYPKIHFCKVFGLGIAFSKPHTIADIENNIVCTCIETKIYLIMWLITINIPIRKSTL